MNVADLDSVPTPRAHNDAFAAKLAGVLEHGLAVAVVMLIDHNAGSRGANQSRQFVLAVLNRLAAQVLAFELD